MASAIIHVAVADKVNSVLKLNRNELLLGTIAPDSAKILGIDRNITHFINDNKDTCSPNIECFLSLYHDKLNTAYDIGYFIHLLTDKLWFDEFLPNFVIDFSTFYDKDGNVVKLDGIDTCELIYNDYTNLNNDVVKYYDLDMNFLNSDFKDICFNIKEVSHDSFDLVIKTMKDFMNKSTEFSFIMNMDRIVHFIEYSTIFVLDELKKIKF